MNDEFLMLNDETGRVSLPGSRTHAESVVRAARTGAPEGGVIPKLSHPLPWFHMNSHGFTSLLKKNVRAAWAIKLSQIKPS
jgi:hypothetical protein